MDSIENKSTLMSNLKDFFNGTKEQLINKVAHLLQGKKEAKESKIADAKVQKFNDQVEENLETAKKAEEKKQQRILDADFTMKGGTTAFGFAAGELTQTAAMPAFCPMQTIALLGAAITIPAVKAGAFKFDGHRLVRSEEETKIQETLIACIRTCTDEKDKVTLRDALRARNNSPEAKAAKKAMEARRAAVEKIPLTQADIDEFRNTKLSGDDLLVCHMGQSDEYSEKAMRFKELQWRIHYTYGHDKEVAKEFLDIYNETMKPINEKRKEHRQQIVNQMKAEGYENCVKRLNKEYGIQPAEPQQSSGVVIRASLNNISPSTSSPQPQSAPQRKR